MKSQVITLTSITRPIYATQRLLKLRQHTTAQCFMGSVDC
jgi:hypothetical protein